MNWHNLEGVVLAELESEQRLRNETRSHVFADFDRSPRLGKILPRQNLVVANAIHAVTLSGCGPSATPPLVVPASGSTL